MIKAIETSYRNFRFRSRNEARWAVFFDSLDIKWEYEAEGYDLGEHGWYLPDFWLPESEQFVELKPENKDKRQKKFYFAGKISPYKLDWRYPLVGAISFFSFDDYKKNTESTSHPSSVCGHQYIGPFSIDEYSGHGPGGHYGGDDHSFHGQIDSEVNEYILKVCKAQIDSADIVFAWINSDDCFGTLAEIGYAHARRKEIWIGYSRDVNSQDFWFVEQMACMAGCFDSAICAFSEFNKPLSDHELKCKALSKKSQVILIEGTPGAESCIADWYARGITKVYAGNLGLASNGKSLCVTHKGWHIPSTKRKVEDAYTAARSARFEHGEKP